MITTPEFRIGDRIKEYRQRKGISQAALGGLIGRSEDWVSKVERNLLPVDRLSLLLDIAQVLNVRDLSEIIGRNIELTMTSSTEHSSVPAIRRAMNQVPSLLGELPGLPLDAVTLARRVDAAWHAYEHDIDRYAIVGPQLPQLLAEVQLASRSAPSRDESTVARTTVSLYHLLQVYLRRIGEHELSRVAADRALNLADSIGDPVLLAASAWNLCSILTGAGDVRESRELALSAIDVTQPGDNASQEHLSVYGALHLACAVSTIRDSKAQNAAAWDLLRAADRVATRLGEDRNDYRTSFGPTNVKMHAVHLAGEEGDAVEALRLADQVEVNPALPLERRTRYLVEVMNASRINRDDYATLFMIGKIREASPEEVCFFPLVREAIRDLLKRERPTYRAVLRDHAAHVGVLAA